jgi:mannose-6-phosphate isomerase-like protein (cupin superfamily)
MKYKVNQNDVTPEKSLKGEDGWNRMQVQFLCNEANMGAQHAVLGRTIFPPNGASHELHVHENAEEIMYIVSGKGTARVGDEEFDIGQGDVVFVPVNVGHIVRNTDPENIMEMIWLYGGVGSLKASGYRHINE